MAETEAVSQCGVPPGLLEMLEEFSEEVLRHRPENIHCFLAEYCEAKLRGMLPSRPTYNGVAQNLNAANVTAGSIPVSTLNKLEEQGRLLEKLRTEVRASQQPEEPKGHRVGTRDDCIKSKMTSVLAQALELVNVLEEIQRMAPQCRDVGSNPETKNNHWTRGEGHRTTQDICTEIHCLVKYMDQLSQEFDQALGNTNCPYHAGNWMPSCGGGGVSNVAPGQVNPYGFGGAVAAPDGIIYMESDLQECPEVWIHPYSGAMMVPLLRQTDAEAANDFTYPDVACAISEFVSQSAPVTQPAAVKKVPQTGLSPSAAALAKLGLAAGGAALAHLSAGNSGETLLPAVTESIAALFGADGEKGEYESALRSITANLGATWQLAEAFGAGSCHWASIIQDFLSNQISLIQKLLTGEIPLTDAPYEVAFLTVAFLVGVIVAYRQLTGCVCSDGNGAMAPGSLAAPAAVMNDTGASLHTILECRFPQPKLPTCL